MSLTSLSSYLTCSKVPPAFVDRMPSARSVNSHFARSTGENQEQNIYDYESWINDTFLTNDRKTQVKLPYLKRNQLTIYSLSKSKIKGVPIKRSSVNPYKGGKKPNLPKPKKSTIEQNNRFAYHLKQISAKRENEKKRILDTSQDNSSICQTTFRKSNSQLSFQTLNDTLKTVHSTKSTPYIYSKSYAPDKRKLVKIFNNTSPRKDKLPIIHRATKKPPVKKPAAKRPVYATFNPKPVPAKSNSETNNLKFSKNLLKAPKSTNILVQTKKRPELKNKSGLAKPNLSTRDLQQQSTTKNYRQILSKMNQIKPVSKTVVKTQPIATSRSSVSKPATRSSVSKTNLRKSQSVDKPKALPSDLRLALQKHSNSRSFIRVQNKLENLKNRLRSSNEKINYLNESAPYNPKPIKYKQNGFHYYTSHKKSTSPTENKRISIRGPQIAQRANRMDSRNDLTKRQYDLKNKIQPKKSMSPSLGNTRTKLPKIANSPATSWTSTQNICFQQGRT